MSDFSERDEAARMRAAMTAQAHSTEPDGDLASRIIGAVDRQEAHMSSSAVRRWAVPLAAASAAALLIGGVVIGINAFNDGNDNAANPPAGVTTSQPAPPSHAPTTNHTATSPAPTKTATQPTVVPVPAGFLPNDLTWVSAAEGWAISKGGVVAHTTDGGATWARASSIAGAVSGIRFANAHTGYAFGPALYTTTDGGVTWVRTVETRETLDVEIAGNSVLRTTSSGSGCPSSCDVKVLSASVGSSDWTDTHLPPTGGFGVTMSRHGNTVAVLSLGHIAGGAQNARSTLYVSADAGGQWSSRGEPCRQLKTPVNGTTEVDSLLASVVDDGAIALLCEPRGAATNEFVQLSTDTGNQWRFGAALTGGGPTQTLGGASSSLLLVSTDAFYRSTDGGMTWAEVGASHGPGSTAGPAKAWWIGFENTSTGRVIAQDAAGDGPSNTIWTTHDGGQTWTAHTFS